MKYANLWAHALCLKSQMAFLGTRGGGFGGKGTEEHFCRCTSMFACMAVLMGKARGATWGHQCGEFRSQQQWMLMLLSSSSSSSLFLHSFKSCVCPKIPFSVFCSLLLAIHRLFARRKQVEKMLETTWISQERESLKWQRDYLFVFFGKRWLRKRCCQYIHLY